MRSWEQLRSCVTEEGLTDDLLREIFAQYTAAPAAALEVSARKARVSLLAEIGAAISIARDERADENAQRIASLWRTLAHQRRNNRP